MHKTRKIAAGALTAVALHALLTGTAHAEDNGLQGTKAEVATAGEPVDRLLDLVGQVDDILDIEPKGDHPWT
ncbi:hypothetical protein [Streptomyces lancefieldiae]|uniref:Secreted protein n=1 Tax=Streptomyces lancefieldiae TaxID=3075520 RepID=A0ABU3AJE6_9ACTN|nr:hypothetical protein [Streptomyces sp. DSM 40712]MDT0610035.1 hypothetical protein [Streptomyces sp. DSM 40712]